MELKYYLRGLGLGIIVTAIIMGVASSRNRTMTDEEIIARAKQLGMTEDMVLTETVSGEKDTPDTEKSSDTAQAAPAPKNEENDNRDDGNITDVNADENRENNENAEGSVENPETPDTLPDAQPDGEEQTEGEEEAGQTENSQENPEENDTEPEEGETQTATAPPGDRPMVITIGNGDGSYQVSLKLVDIGAVSSATDYDNFLCDNGYDKRIRTGTHTIPAGASDEQIARIITGIE